MDHCQALDPDILAGYDVQTGSIGYLSDRASQIGLLPLLRSLSRTPDKESIKERQDDEWGRLQASGIHCTGKPRRGRAAGAACMTARLLAAC